MGPLVAKPQIFEELDGVISKTWKDQKVLGAEYRQSKRPDQKIIINHLNKNGDKDREVLYAFQAPGIKTRGNRNNRMATIVYPNEKENS